MKYLKHALLIAVVAAAWAGIGTASAGAAVLCTTNANCTTSHNGGAGGQMYDKDDLIVANGPGLQITTSGGDVTCNKAQTIFKLTGTGAPGFVVPGETTLDIEECTFVSKGGVKIACADVHVEGAASSVSLGTAPNGFLTVSNLFVPMVCGGGLSCWLGGKSLKLTLTGGNPATISATKLTLEAKAGGPLCPESAELDASFKTTSAVWVQSG